jgi:hypothetical protein
MTIREKTAVMKALMKRAGAEVDNDIRCMMIILITKLITIPTQSIYAVFEDFIQQVSSCIVDEPVTSLET